MAVRRMIHADVLHSDAFLDLPFSAQMLYVQLTMSADDDGFYNGARNLVRFIGASPQDLDLLIRSRFLLAFGEVVVIKHWRMANSLKSDRLKPPAYPEIAEKLYIKPNRAYTDHPEEGAENFLEARMHGLKNWNPNGIPREEKGKEENRKEEKGAEVEADGIQTAAAADQEPLKKMEGTLGKGVLMLTDAQTEDLLDKMGLDCFDYYTDKLSSFILEKQAKVRNHYQTLLRWWQEDRHTEEAVT